MCVCKSAGGTGPSTWTAWGSDLTGIIGSLRGPFGRPTLTGIPMSHRPSPDATLVILTGAGISAESGLRTFRAEDGLWEDHRVEEVATPEAFRKDPDLVHRFYNERRRQLAGVRPNPAHAALARLEQAWPGDVLLVTQNVDDLHERAGSRNLVHLHGELLKARCEACGRAVPWPGDLDRVSRCPHCALQGRLRPHIIWFGEMPLELDRV